MDFSRSIGRLRRTEHASGSDASRTPNRSTASREVSWEAPRPAEIVPAGDVIAPREPVSGDAPHVRSSFEELRAAVTIAESLGLGYHLGLAVERLVLAERDGEEGVQRLCEAIWLIERQIALIGKTGHAEALATIREHLGWDGEVVAGLRALSSAVYGERFDGPAIDYVPAPGPAAPASSAQSTSRSGRVPPARAASTTEAGALPYDPAAPDPAVASTPAPAPTADDPYPLGRELLVMVVRSGLILIVLVIVLVVATIASNWG